MRADTSSAGANTSGPNRNANSPVAERRAVVSYVRKLQRHQGDDPCFMTEARYSCMEFDCRWRSDCMRLVAECFR